MSSFNTTLASLTLILCFAIPDAYAMRTDKPKNYRPDKVSKLCEDEIKDPANKYSTKEYYASTYIVARLAGYKELDAYTLAFYSRYPEFDTNFSAKHLEYVNMFTPWRWDWRDDVKDTLHALHGGGSEKIEKRRKHLEAATTKLLGKRKPNFWNAGIMLHTYADSFMHIEEDEGETVAKEGLIGSPHRLFVGERLTNPETLKNYFNYTDNLFMLLNKANKNQGNPRAYANFKAQMQSLACKPDGDCDDPEYQKMDELLKNLSGQLNYNLTIFNCMRDKARLLYESEMKEIMENMREPEE